MRTTSRRSRLLIASATAALVAGVLSPALVGGAAQASDSDFAPRLVTVDTPTRADKELLQTLGLDLTEHAGHDYIEVVLHNGGDLARLSDSGLDHDVRIPDLNLRSAQNNRANAAYAAATESSPLPSGRDTYRTLADYNKDISALAASHPSIAKQIEMPHKSLDGRTVHGIEIGRDVAAAEDGRPTFLLLGVHHAREWPSGELAMEFAHDLVKNYGSDQRITGLLDKSRVIVVPVVNVDGFELSRTDGGTVDLREVDNGGLASNLATPGNAYKRKNCRAVDGQDLPDGTCRATSLTSPGGFGIGVDPNRNYGGFWGGPGASDVNADPTYRGAGPFSEPETQNVQELVSSRQVTTLISNHTYSNLVLRPNGVHPDTIGPDGNPVGDAPDEAGLKALGAKMTAANGYRNIHGWELYDTTGTTEDWSYNATGGYGYTFEIGPDEF
ncbi:MAG: M14 family zinc carboxypeptidase, partial [Aeromicrobium sp.]|uniref:M14 family zinc carboxypeptidase n=1 Tax=Aeromicrobium sp. TaxID=1871063 RepID=UPI003C3CEDED